jgi:hypothetical protein
MATNTNTNTNHNITCHCGRAAYVTLSHQTCGLQYAYAWCATCGTGTYNYVGPVAA